MPLLRHASKVAVVASVFCVASLAAAAPLPPSAASLPGSSFQGADGNQTDVPPLTDWQGLAAANRVNHTPDPNDLDTAFKGGSEEDKPGLWDFATEAGGVSPGKSNILDAWEVYESRGGDAFVYLAFARQSASSARRSSPSSSITTRGSGTTGARISRAERREIFSSPSRRTATTSRSSCNAGSRRRGIRTRGARRPAASTTTPPSHPTSTLKERSTTRTSPRTSPASTTGRSRTATSERPR